MPNDVSDGLLVNIKDSGLRCRGIRGASIMIELAFTVQLALPQILERLRGGGELLASNKPSGSRGNSC
ncbi:hypothetical protein CBS63078_3394 [Aspergillus niger]|nr:hypothetical protein CBS133816_9913 [Aspergillus niger]KAI2823712.1 hypothetical protein CBS115989_1301 [Aspergillus niger]KAI2838167.1 hypothetical protein CBS11350_8381 [Aspergillus niger]KAI2858733.1 hypothetical protein CBS11232_2499 [Aspergillus niger]KAI2866208.1 hypothetical protein CBS12448_1316 [Aspergillus niger]